MKRLLGLVLTVVALAGHSNAQAQPLPCPSEAQAPWGAAIINVNAALQVSQMMLGMVYLDAADPATMHDLPQTWRDVGERWQNADFPPDLAAVETDGEQLTMIAPAFFEAVNQGTVTDSARSQFAEAIAAYQAALDQAGIGVATCSHDDEGQRRI